MTHLISTSYGSPVGMLTLVASHEGLRAVIWPDGRLDRVGLNGETLTPGDGPILDATVGQLDECDEVVVSSPQLGELKNRFVAKT